VRVCPERSGRNVPDNGLVTRRATIRAGAAAGLAGPAVFTGAWIAGSVRQSGYGAIEVQISGLAAPDARDPWVMITGFVVLGGCAVAFGEALHEAIGGAAPRLIQGAGALTIAAGLLRRDHMLLEPGPVSWHNQAHNVVSAVIYVDLVVAQALLARAFARDAAWRPWRGWLAASAAATAVVLIAFGADTSEPAAGVLQRIAVTLPLAAVAAIAARLASRPVPGPRTPRRAPGAASARGLASGGYPEGPDRGSSAGSGAEGAAYRPVSPRSVRSLITLPQ
jgi:Protein of unknown function (DUF998)